MTSEVMRVARPIVLGCVGLAAVFPATVAAAVTPTFDRTRAHVGERVTIFQPGGLHWLAKDSRPIRVYLVPASAAGSMTRRSDGRSRLGPPGRRAVFLGRLRMPAGRLTFAVPHVQPGRYAALAWCGPCGGTLIASVPWNVPDGVEIRNDGSLLRVVR